MPERVRAKCHFPVSSSDQRFAGAERQEVGIVRSPGAFRSDIHTSAVTRTQHPECTVILKAPLHVAKSGVWGFRALRAQG